MYKKVEVWRVRNLRLFKNNMSKYLTYLNYVIRHKWFVFVECCRQRIVWQGIIHDCSKFRPSEFIPYARHDWDSEEEDKALDYAWLLHQKRNRHHWQFWSLLEDEGGIKVLEMPEKYVKEMVCDWAGAGKAKGVESSVDSWYQKNKHKMRLHPHTQKQIEKITKEV